MNWRSIVVAAVSSLSFAAIGCTTGPDAGADEDVQVDTDESNLTSCCVSARNGNDCWRKCDGRWKDLLSNETCALARGDGGCTAEFRTGGGCWRKCNGRWKDRLPTEELCQVNACGQGTTTPTPGSSSGSTSSVVTLHTFSNCDDFFTVATLTPTTDCFDVFGSVGSVKKDGVCTALPFGMTSSEACRANKPSPPALFP